MKKCSTLFLLISKPDVAAEGEKKIHRIHKKPIGMEVAFDSKGNAAVHSRWEFPKHFDKIISLERDFFIPDTLQKAQVPLLSCGPAARHKWQRSLSSGASQPLSARKELPDPASRQEMVPGSRCWLGQSPFPARNNSETLQTITFLLFWALPKEK